MKLNSLKKFLYYSLLPITVISISSCDGGYSPANAYEIDVPTAKKVKGINTVSHTLKPTVRFPARLAVAKVSPNYSGDFSLSNSKIVEKPEFQKKLTNLDGIAGIVNLNNVITERGTLNDSQLQSSARKFGANILGIYRFNTSTHRTDGASILQLASLGLAPINRHKSNSSVSLTLMDAKTGYIYGVLEESANKRSLSSAWGNDNAQNNTEFRAEQVALDELAESFPAFWEKTYQQYKR